MLSLLMFFQYFIMGSWVVTLGTYMLETRFFTGTQVGLTYGAQAIAAMITPFFAGIIADRYFSSERLLSLVYLSSSIFLLSSTFFQSFWVFYAFLLIYNLLAAPSFSLSNAITLHHVNDPQKDFPRIRVWGTIGWMVAGVMIGFLGVETTAIPIRLSAITSILMSVFCLFLPSTPPLMKRRKKSFYSMIGLDTLQFFKTKSMLVMVVAVALITIPAGFYYTFTNPFLNELGMKQAAGKMALGQLVEIIIMLLMPFCFRWLGVKKMLFVGLFAWGVRYILFALGDNQTLVWMLYGGILIHGISYNFTALAAQIEVDRIVPKEYRGSAQGFLTFIKMGVGAFIGTLTAGLIVSFYSFGEGNHDWTSIWLYPTIFSIIVAIGFYILFPGKEKRYFS